MNTKVAAPRGGGSRVRDDPKYDLQLVAADLKPAQLRGEFEARPLIKYLC